MKVKSFPLVLIILALLFFSCELFIDIGGNGGGNIPTTPQFRDFRGHDFTNDTAYTVRAQLLYEGTRCNVWAEVAANVNPNTAYTIGSTYDNTIFPRMINAFNDGTAFSYAGSVVARNPMELADFIGDRDGKLLILLLDIRDGFDWEKSPYYIAGYFNFEDLFSRLSVPNSNEADMIYIDTYPGLSQGFNVIHDTIAHEMQHLMNFALSFATRQREMDLWINEGLSEASAWIWSGQHSQSRINWYNNDPLGTIAAGNNFFVWDNHTSRNPEAVLDDYATVYLFFQWLRLQAGSPNIYRYIINSPFVDHRAVTTAASTVLGGRGYDDWGTLLKTWLAANYINAPSGPYGYRNDPVLRYVQSHYLSGSASSFPLFPGEGVYTKKTTMPAATEHIRYAGLPARGSTSAPNEISAIGSSALLSYNIDIRINGTTSPSRPFSVETALPPRSTSTVTCNLSQQRQELSGPYVIGARDLLRMRGFENSSFELDFSKLHRELTVNE
jgi:hypothetical protein